MLPIPFGKPLPTSFESGQPDPVVSQPYIWPIAKKTAIPKKKLFFSKLKVSPGGAISL